MARSVPEYLEADLYCNGADLSILRTWMPQAVVLGPDVLALWRSIKEARTP